MHGSPLSARVLFEIGPVAITEPVVTTAGIVALLGALAALLTRRLSMRPNRGQAVLEILVTGILDQMETVLKRDPRPLLPIVGTLFIFLVVANLAGVVPGVHAPTAKIETPAALAIVVFFSVHWFGIRERGIGGHLAGFTRPTILMLPLNLLSELTRIFSLMIRLFGNVMSGEFVIALVLSLAGLFVPIPLMLLEIMLGLVQAYIFTILATVFIGAAIAGSEA